LQKILHLAVWVLYTKMIENVCDVISDAVLKSGLGLKTIFEVLVLAKAVLALTLDDLKDLKKLRS